MTKIPNFLPPSSGNGRLTVFFVYPGLGLLDFTGPQTTLWAATRWAERRGREGYERVVVSMQGGPILTAEGVEISSLPVTSLGALSSDPLIHPPIAPPIDPSIDRLVDPVVEPFIDLLVVPGSPAMESIVAAPESAAMINWIRAAARRSRRVMSVCTGTFLLAAAGLLDNKRAATHWFMCNALAERFPLVKIDSDAIFVHDDNVWTSAGVSAGIDLALAITEADVGHDVAIEVARELVVYLKRPGGQSQFSELLKMQSAAGGAFDELHLWVMNNISNASLGVDDLALQARMTPRTFMRTYKKQTGRTPAKTVELLRVESAKRLLSSTEHSMPHVAKLTGFGDEERMRLSFQRHTSLSPRDYRKRFSPVLNEHENV